MVLVDINLCESTSVYNDDGLFTFDSFRSNFVVEEFGPTFRKKAGIDPFLRIVGVSDYVNAILVPELTVLLIMEDMRVTEKVARDILYRSAELGELLNEETTSM